MQAKRNAIKISEIWNHTDLKLLLEDKQCEIRLYEPRRHKGPFRLLNATERRGLAADTRVSWVLGSSLWFQRAWGYLPFPLQREAWGGGISGEIK